MTVEELRRILAERRDELASLGVASLAVFGSVARGDAGPDSDVDLLIEFDRPVGLFHLARVQRELAEMLGRPVDLGTADSLKPWIREQVLGEAVHAA